MKDALASDMVRLESKVPDGKKIDGRLKKIEASLVENRNEVKAVDRGLEYAVEQMDQLEQNLGLQHILPAH
eukprot:7938930-Prorocentrum_lima.AAC.1